MGPQDRYGQRATAGGPSRRRSHACACHPASQQSPSWPRCSPPWRPCSSSPPRPPTPTVPAPVRRWLVSVGDSYISGEAGRWAGSSNTSSSYADALGATAYYDNAGSTGEQINRCHRSKAAEVYVGGGVNGLNLACSGAKTSTYTDRSGYFKPGLDFADDGAGHLGQAKMLQQLRGHPQREDGRRLDRRQRLQLRVDRAAVRDRLPGLAVVVQGLLQRRLARSPRTSRRRTSRRSAAGSPRPTPTSGRRCATPATPTAPGRCWCRTTRRRCPPGAGFRYSQSRLHPAEHRRLRLLERRRRLGQRAPRCRRSTAP